ncbi:malonyl-[acyl-carrier protein] O-methyltransferase BioC [Luteimonas aestuarii]|uniref:Malonyl-[acyl-carrier protein] O-methyltransferase n=1 Tax=Luteimonas aestuarii TaxID=453837 RepID=A0A4V3ALH8_9GAMM|nr:malonyl-ACP O-methyltransferase BioC [Luteimonas aestuarii]TDK23108.1 malonyl-[acyl-carrier protein] O-methyltransferase BioC [Luteimonas aestuarii]
MSGGNPPVFDTRQVRHAFSRASNSYASASALQREVEGWLLESLDYLDDRVPGLVLDVGCGPGNAARAMRARWPKARVVALDLALPMLRQSPARDGWNPLRKPIDRVCADLRALPLADASVDVLFSNLCLQWVDDLPAAFAGFRRVLKPGGLLLCSTFGPDTLHELRDAFSQADAVPHVSPFVSIAAFGDALVHAGFRDPVLDRDVLVRGHADLPGLMRELRALGATNALHSRRHTLTGRARFAAASAAYEPRRRDDGQLPASWEVITAMAWAPAPGAPIRGVDGETASFPAHRIPVRRR